jgi:hypothetical protein
MLEQSLINFEQAANSPGVFDMPANRPSLAPHVLMGQAEDAAQKVVEIYHFAINSHSKHSNS